MWYEWIFSGIGTTILSGLGGIVIGAIGGYKVGVRSKGKQNQKAKDGAKQRQEIDVQAEVSEGEKSHSFCQKQKAGSNVEQTQIGSVRIGK